MGDRTDDKAKPSLSSIVNRGSSALRKARFEEAARCFKNARDITARAHGKRSMECYIMQYLYAVSLLYEIPFLGDDDPLDFVPKEADYFLAKNRSYSSYRRSYSGTLSQEDYANKMEAAQKELQIAWSILENVSNCYQEKANTMCALGEVALRRGEANPEHYYIHASSFTENLKGEIDTQRIADMYPLLVWYWISYFARKKIIAIPVLSLLFTSMFNSKSASQIIARIRTSKLRNAKICICLEGRDKNRAIEYGKKALSSYQTRLKKLIFDTESSSKPAETETSSSESSSASSDPSIQPKKLERSKLITIISKLGFKLDDLEAGLSTSPNLEGTSKAPTGHRDGKEKLSQLVQVLKSQGQFDD